MLILFGISWIAYAAGLPIPVYTSCSNGNVVGPSNVPACGSPSPQAQGFYAIGISSLIIGSAMLIIRVRPTYLPVSKTEVIGVYGPTPARFLKKCGKCGTEVPLAAEKCYSCGAKV